MRSTGRTGAFFDENVLMVIATAGALVIHAYSEAVAVMIFHKIGEMLQNRAVAGSRRSIRGLLAARPDQAVVETAEGFRTVFPEDVWVGDILLVKPGERVPLDGEILSGRAQGIDRVLMLTGDNRCAAETVSRYLALDGFHAGLLPEQKVAALEQILLKRQAAGKIAFVGDGINDAPVIARADVGVAMADWGPMPPSKPRTWCS